MLAAGYVTKQACFALGFGDSFYCFSDYGPVYHARELASGRFPYLAPPLEYPAGLGLVVWLAASVTTTGLGFARMNMLFAAGACVGTAWILWRHVGRRAMWFAAAPTIALYAFLNWDLIALVFAVAAVAAFVRKRDVPAGVFLGAGAAIKAFPVLLLVPLLAERLREKNSRSAARLSLAAAVPLVLVNVAVAWASFDGWSHFFRFSSARPVDWGTLWSVGCQTMGSDLCANVPLVNTLALAACLVGSILAWVLITRAAPDIPRWQLAFPLMIVFFLTNKVYSPQYSLWILPWFALVLPNLGFFIAYEVIDIGIYATTFAWQQRLSGSGGLPLWPLNVFVLARAVVLIAMLVAFVRRAAMAR